MILQATAVDWLAVVGLGILELLDHGRSDRPAFPFQLFVDQLDLVVQGFQGGIHPRFAGDTPRVNGFRCESF